MDRLFLVLSMCAFVSTLPIETIVASNEGNLSALLLNWTQVAFEAFLEWIKNDFGIHNSTTAESSHKVLIVTGGPYPKKTKIIDLKENKLVCFLPDFPIQMAYGVGGIVDGEIPMICGGWNGRTIFKMCFKLVDKTWKEAGILESGKTVEMGSGNIIINGSLLLSGGYAGSRSDKTQLMDSSNSIKELKGMPIAISGHCNVMLNSSHLLIIGGWDSNARSETLILDLVKEEWTNGPSMRAKTYLHGCTQMILGEKQIIWVTGGYDGSNFLQSTQYLEDLDQGWQSGIFRPLL